MRKNIIKPLAAITVAAQIYGLLFPVCAYALTSGPTQPEMQSFEPIGTTEMVDLFSGDFNYNIALLNVPGPRGGYPINIAYHAGIGMEQEASWVGLGWNINPGVVNRQMRGLPDDFNGDKVIREMNIKPNITAGIEFSKALLKKELFGFDLGYQLSKNYQLYYNNYKGVGVSAGWGLSGLAKSSYQHKFSPALRLDFDTQQGTSLTPAISSTKYNADRYTEYTTGVTYNARQGAAKLFLDTERGFASHTYDADLDVSFYEKEGGTGPGPGTSFATSAYIPNVDMPMRGFSAGLEVAFGPENTGDFSKKKIKGFYSESTLRDEGHQEYGGYGYMYMQHADKYSMRDYCRENDFNVTRYVPRLPMPVASNDVFAASGQGTGAVFRTTRSDLGRLAGPATSQHTGGGAGGIEFGAASGIKIGTNGEWHVSETYSGTWTGQDEAIGSMQYKGNGRHNTYNETQDPLYEPFYFKASGEQTAAKNSTLPGENPFRFRITPSYTGSDWRPRIHDVLEDESGNTLQATDKNIPEQRATRVQQIQTRTMRQKALEGSFSQPASVYEENTFPLLNPGAAGKKYDFAHRASASPHHVGEVTIQNPDGNTYSYGIPVYNTLQRDVTFAITNQTYSGKTVPYQPSDASKNNEKGQDHFYSRTDIPSFPHSFLLTQIVSPDYVDITGNGPSEDDLGYYVKFNYTQLHGPHNESNPADDGYYKWRVPYTAANFQEGFHSNDMDDKASYTYGEKEIWYLNSVETKTHIAVFTLGTRHDGYGVASEYNVLDSVNASHTGASLRKLEEIKLYSKSNLNIPIKTVHFEYDYELCPGVESNDLHPEFRTGSDGIIKDINQLRGKLTLKKIWFTHEGNTKGRLSPYRFSYGFNPSYQINGMDRWGNYKPEQTTGAIKNVENPYVKQDTKEKNVLDEQMSAWNLKEIILPSGGTIRVEYESDTYAYVQDKPAMYMANIVKDDGSAGDLPVTNDEAFRKIYFKLKTPVAVTDPDAEKKIKAYVQGLDLLYFKTFANLKKRLDKSSEDAWDYVEGYTEMPSGISYGNDFGYGNTLENYNGVSCFVNGFIRLPEVRIADNKDVSLGKTHPFRKRGWQYLKLNRPDLLYNAPQGKGVKQLVSGILSLVKDAGSMLFGYYSFANTAGYCKFIDPQRSFIRLNIPDGIKYGGGHRVKKITVSDNWIDGNADYGQEYAYSLPDGKSSGVTEWEPETGGEENPFRQPLYYANNIFVKADDKLYLDEPPGRSCYPAPNVGYSRVVMKSLRREENGQPVNTSTGAGSTVTDFYTAKDFPVIAIHTGMQEASYRPPVIYIPFIGMQTVVNTGYSQGYSVVLNDMHGKQKSIATYAHKSDEDNPSSTPVSKTTWYYRSKKNADGRNTPDNYATVLTADGVYENALLGQTEEFIADLREESDYTAHKGFQLNADIVLPFLFTAMGLPLCDNIRTLFRSVVTSRVIYKTGILEKVVQNNDGAVSTTQHLAYDASSGKPLLSSLTNNFDAQVYQYTYPAHWFYPGMRGAFARSGTLFYDRSTSTSPEAGSMGIVNAAAYFKEGDEVEAETSLLSLSKKYWVKKTDTDHIVLIDEAGLPASFANATIRILKPAEKNLQLLDCGSLVTLRDPRLFPAENKCREGNNYSCLQVLQASAVTYNNEWDYDYRDIPAPLPGGNTYEEMAATNPFRYGQKGVWRQESDYAYLANREQTVPKTRIEKDGVFEHFNAFDWSAGAANQQWTKKSERTRYSPYGFPVEERDALNRYTCALYGYGNSLLKVSGTNLRAGELSFEDFEDPSSPVQTHAWNNSETKLSGERAHTGKNSLKAKGQEQFRVMKIDTLVSSGKDYVVSLWVSRKDNTTHSYKISDPDENKRCGVKLAFLNEAKQLISYSPLLEPSGELIEGWQRIETETAIPAGTRYVDVRLYAGTNWLTDIAWFDDLRIFRAEGTMKSFVYNPYTFRLLAGLDDRNYATFYNYDEEGIPVQVKQETERGIFTVRTTRQNLKQK